MLLNIKEITDLASAVLNEEEVKVNQVIGDLKAQFTYCIEEECTLPPRIIFSASEWECAGSDDDIAEISTCMSDGDTTEDEEGGGGNSYQEEIHRAQEEKFRNLEFYYLLSLTNPTEEHIDKLSKMRIAPNVGWNKNSGICTPLRLMCRNNQSGNLNRCITVLEPLLRLENILNKIRQHERNLELFDNSQRTDGVGYNALHYICMNYQRDDFLKIFHQLTSTTFGFDVNFTDQTNFGRNALQLLFRSNKRNDLIHIVRAFIEKGINLKYRNKNGWTALHYLCRHYSHDNLIEIAKLMIENGAEGDVKENLDDLTALHLLCENYNHDNLIELVKFLIENGTDINAKLKSDGCTSLHILCENYNHFNLKELIQLLIEKGVDVNLKTKDGYTAVDKFKSNYKQDNMPQIIQLLSADGNDFRK